MPHLLKNLDSNFLRAGMKGVKLFHIKSNILVILHIFVHICHGEHDVRVDFLPEKKCTYYLHTKSYSIRTTSSNTQDGTKLVTTHTYLQTDQHSTGLPRP